MKQVIHAFPLFRRTFLLLIIIAANASAQVTILSPNGGEKFKVGSSTTIRWTGVAAADTVKLEYSIDNGINWNLITGTATGLQYQWSGIPNMPSDKCLMRISTNAKIGDSVLFLDSRINGNFFGEPIHFAEFSPDGKRVVGGGANGDVFIWDSFTGAVLKWFTVETASFPSNPGITKISRARWSPDGKFFVTISPLAANTGSFVRIFDATTFAKIREFQQVEGPTISTSGTCVYSPDGTRLLVMGERGGRITDLTGANPDVTIKGYVFTSGTTTTISSMVEGDWSRDGTHIIGAPLNASGGPVFILTDPATGDTIRTYFPPTTGQLNSVRFSPDGTKFISASTDSTVRVTDVASGAELFRIKDYQRYPNWAQFSHGGTLFATAGQDISTPNWKLILYDAITGAPIRTVARIGAGMQNVDFSPDDSRLLVSCIDGARIFHAPGVTAGASDISDSLWSIVLAPGANVTISIPSVRARQGESVDIPVTINDPAGALASGATKINVTLRYNVSLLDPAGLTPRGTFDALLRTIPLTFPIASSTDTVLGMLHFKAALGDDSVTVLDLIGAIADIPTVTVFENDGAFTLNDLCYAGGARLLNPNGIVMLKVVSARETGTQLDADIETVDIGPTRLTLVNAMGREIKRIIDGDMAPGRRILHLDLDDIASGRYFLILSTPVITRTAAVQVIR